MTENVRVDVFNETNGELTAAKVIALLIGVAPKEYSLGPQRVGLIAATPVVSVTSVNVKVVAEPEYGMINAVYGSHVKIV